ncbi:ankyrin [Hypoxylon crocopeplum]|nr:ankyrin [Hypoxylon crocopeplum]
MDILSFPPEVLHDILVYAALGRGIKRALRLRLVCTAFSQLMPFALFETRLMDNTLLPGLGSDDWQGVVQHGAIKVWHKYIIYRTLDEKDSTIGRFVEIRQMAQAICQETTLELQTIIEALCWLALSHRTRLTNKSQWRMWARVEHRMRLIHEDQWGPLVRGVYKPEANLGLNMLTAAAHLNLFPLAKRLLAEGHEPTSTNFLFAPPLQVASQAGNVAMLQLLQEYLPCTRPELWSVLGAAMRGDMNVLKVALRTGGSTDECIDGQPFGSIEFGSETGDIILQAIGDTSNPEIHDYLTGALAPQPPTTAPFAYYKLEHHAGLGNISMVRHLLGLGAPVQLHETICETPLVMACKRSHNDVADLLLENGADPNFATGALHESATAGNLSLARKLLQAGALPNRRGRRNLKYGEYPALLWAFAREHESMIELLLAHGATFGGAQGWLGPCLVRMAYHPGYSTMTEILHAHGFPVAQPPLPPQLTDTWTTWDDGRVLPFTQSKVMHRLFAYGRFLRRRGEDPRRLQM